MVYQFTTNENDAPKYKEDLHLHFYPLHTRIESRNTRAHTVIAASHHNPHSLRYHRPLITNIHSLRSSQSKH
ncbi:hypothetical protein VNO80_05013 [Phaseolus coccineus]|uniref:Uncharacterized protein n=1 Tax=Phaseolus coccineus TaxID=3886 RepID=A0AAN9RK57_PHACN